MGLCFHSHAEYQLEPWEIKAPGYSMGASDLQGGADIVKFQPDIYLQAMSLAEAVIVARGPNARQPLQRSNLKMNWK